MKKILYIMCAVLLLASCNKEELKVADSEYTFNVGLEEPGYVSKTKADVTISRYVLEVYEAQMTAPPVRMESPNGAFKVNLKKGVDYICLFWADNGKDYNVTDLTAVKQSDETVLGTVAYCGTEIVNSETFNGAITLKRAVAELSFINTNMLHEGPNTLKITYPYGSATLNVLGCTVSYTVGETVRTIKNIVPVAQTTDAFAADFVFAPKEVVDMVGLKLQFNNEIEKTIAKMNIQANCKTKITGGFIF